MRCSRTIATLATLLFCMIVLDVVNCKDDSKKPHASTKKVAVSSPKKVEKDDNEDAEDEESDEDEDAGEESEDGESEDDDCDDDSKCNKKSVKKKKVKTNGKEDKKKSEVTKEKNNAKTKLNEKEKSKNGNKNEEKDTAIKEIRIKFRNTTKDIKVKEKGTNKKTVNDNKGKDKTESEENNENAEDSEIDEEEGESKSKKERIDSNAGKVSNNIKEKESESNYKQINGNEKVNNAKRSTLDFVPIQLVTRPRIRKMPSTIFVPIARDNLFMNTRNRNRSPSQVHIIDEEYYDGNGGVGSSLGATLAIPQFGNYGSFINSNVQRSNRVNNEVSTPGWFVPLRLPGNVPNTVRNRNSQQDFLDYENAPNYPNEFKDTKTDTTPPLNINFKSKKSSNNNEKPKYSKTIAPGNKGKEKTKHTHHATTDHEFDNGNPTVLFHFKNQAARTTKSPATKGTKSKTSKKEKQ